MNEKYRNIEDIYDNYNDVTPQYDEKESFKEDTDLDETLPKTFEGKIYFLAADEEEAIEGYDKVLLALTDKKYEHIRKQLEIIRDEEVAHKEFLEKAINDLKAIYVDPSENREEYSDKLTEKDDNKVKKLRVVEKVVERTLSRSYLNKDGYGYRLSLTKEDAISFVKMEKVKVNKLEEMVLVCEKDLTRKQLDDAVAIFKKANDYYFTSGFLNRKLRKLFGEK